MSESAGRTATPERPQPADTVGFLRRLRRLPARTSLFIRQVVAELRKVVYPTRSQLLTYTAVVMVFVAVMMLIVTLLDLAFGQLVLRLFGGS